MSVRDRLQQTSLAILEGTANHCKDVANRTRASLLDSKNMELHFETVPIEELSGLTKTIDFLVEATIYGRLDIIKSLREDKNFPWNLNDLIAALYFLDFETMDKIMTYVATDTGDGRQATLEYLKNYFLCFNYRPIPLKEWIWKRGTKVFGSINFKPWNTRFGICAPESEMFKSEINERPADNHYNFLSYALWLSPPLERSECSFGCAVPFWFFLDHYHPLQKWLPENLLNPVVQYQTNLLPPITAIYLKAHKSLLTSLDSYFPRELSNIVRSYFFLWEILSQDENCDFGW